MVWYLSFLQTYVVKKNRFSIIVHYIVKRVNCLIQMFGSLKNILSASSVNYCLSLFKIFHYDTGFISLKNNWLHFSLCILWEYDVRCMHNNNIIIVYYRWGVLFIILYCWYSFDLIMVFVLESVLPPSINIATSAISWYNFSVPLLSIVFIHK